MSTALHARQKPGPKAAQGQSRWTARIPASLTEALEEEAKEHGFSRNDWISLVLADRYGQHYTPLRKPRADESHGQEALLQEAS